MTTSSRTRAALAFLVLWVAACGDDVSRSIGPDSEIGALTVHLQTSRPDDGAVLVLVRGEGIDQVELVDRAHTLYVRQDPRDANVVRFALIGDRLAGELVRFRVPRGDRISEYSVELLEVADEEGRLRPSLSGYELTLLR